MRKATLISTAISVGLALYVYALGWFFVFLDWLIPDGYEMYVAAGLMSFAVFAGSLGIQLFMFKEKR